VVKGFGAVAIGRDEETARGVWKLGTSVGRGEGLPKPAPVLGVPPTTHLTERVILQKRGPVNGSIAVRIAARLRRSGCLLVSAG
jgi:hypothetical protein